MVDVIGVLPSAAPAIIDRLLDLATAHFSGDDDAAPCTVVDAIDTSGDNGDQLVIGAGDPDVDDYTEAVDATAEWSGSGQYAEREEIGQITCCAVAADGTSVRKARERAYAIAGELGVMCHQNWTLKKDPTDPVSPGVDGLEWVRFGSSSRLIQGIDADGSFVAVVLFRIQFQALI